MSGLVATLLQYFLVAKLATVPSPPNSPLPLGSCSMLCSGYSPGIPLLPMIQQLKARVRQGRRPPESRHRSEGSILSADWLMNLVSPGKVKCRGDKYPLSTSLLGGNPKMSNFRISCPGVLLYTKLLIRHWLEKPNKIRFFASWTLRTLTWTIANGVSAEFRK